MSQLIAIVNKFCDRDMHNLFFIAVYRIYPAKKLHKFFDKDGSRILAIKNWSCHKQKFLYYN